MRKVRLVACREGRVGRTVMLHERRVMFVCRNNFFQQERKGLKVLEGELTRPCREERWKMNQQEMTKW